MRKEIEEAIKQCESDLVGHVNFDVGIRNFLHLIRLVIEEIEHNRG